MITIDNLEILAFEKDFRNQFSELQTHFEALDKLGGKNCKNCNKNRQKLILRDMYNATIKLNLSDRYKTFYDAKIRSGGINKSSAIDDDAPSYSKLPISLDQFIPCLLFPEVKEIISRHLGEKSDELLGAILRHGVYSAKTKEAARPIYPLIYKKGLFEAFSDTLNKLGIIDKVRSTPNPLKVKILKSDSDLEGEINRFILGKNITSIQKDGQSALVIYR